MRLLSNYTHVLLSKCSIVQRFKPLRTVGIARFSDRPEPNHSQEESTGATSESKEREGNTSIDAKYKELHKSYLTILADMENLRVRTRKEVEQASIFSVTKFAKDMLSVSDILETALNSIPQSFKDSKGTDAPKHLSEPPVKSNADSNLQQAFTSFVSGVEMTHHELLNTFKRHGVESFDSLHNVFDPNIHMALYDVPKSSVSLPTSITSDSTLSKQPIVIDEQKKGFKIKDRVLRPAQVGIAR
jgi:molecular chaperone GrpE